MGALLWNTILYQPIVNLLIFLYRVLFENFGLAIIALTLFLRVLLIPFTLPAIKTAKKQKEISHLLEDIKEKYRGDKKKQAEEQMKLFKKSGINPMAGCLPQIIQLVILIALYQAFIQVLGTPGQEISALNNLLYFKYLKFADTENLNIYFLYLNLTKPDLWLPIFAGGTQFLLSKMMLPQTKFGGTLSQETEKKSDDIMYSMQQQMLFLMPLLTVFIGWKLPSGLTLYWLVSTLFSLLQQKFFQGSLG